MTDPAPPASDEPSLVRIEPGLRRLRASNPSPMTGSGTNTYILGHGRVAVIDPGPDDPVHLAAILAALDPGETVAQILVTHAHADHSGLARRLAATTGAPVLASAAPPPPRDAALAGIGGGEGIDTGFAPDQRLEDGAVVAGEGWTLRAIHTPGHLHDHLCLAWGDLCFSGDHVMGWATSIVSPPEGDMGAYMASLEKLAQGRWRRLHPGHGDAVGDPAGRIAELATHRRQRETAILDALRRAPQTPAGLTRRIYHATPAGLLPAAERNVLAHLIDLQSRNFVTRGPGTALEATYAPT